MSNQDKNINFSKKPKLREIMENNLSLLSGRDIHLTSPHGTKDVLNLLSWRLEKESGMDAIEVREALAGKLKECIMKELKNSFENPDSLEPLYRNIIECRVGKCEIIDRYKPDFDQRVLKTVYDEYGNKTGISGCPFKEKGSTDCSLKMENPGYIDPICRHHFKRKPYRITFP